MVLGHQFVFLFLFVSYLLVAYTAYFFDKNSPLFSPRTREYVLRRPNTLIKYQDTELTLKYAKLIHAIYV